MTQQEIKEIYALIANQHQRYLAIKGVLLPALKNSQNYTKNALVLVKLAQNYPNTAILSKEELTQFIRDFYPGINDVQQARHLAIQSGFYIVSGTRGDNGNENIPSGSYKLVSLEEPHPSFVPHRKTGLTTNDFEELKKIYHYHCAVCGSKEGEEHLIRNSVIVQLQQGHMNPEHDLVAGNIIPQCQICNRPDRNRWIYDNTGRVIAVANSQDGKRVVLKFLEKSSEAVRQEILAYLSNMNRK
jgi:hypothetical protein